VGLNSDRGDVGSKKRKIMSKRGKCVEGGICRVELGSFFYPQEENNVLLLQQKKRENNVLQA
jgi:hypothetical protein